MRPRPTPSAEHDDRRQAIVDAAADLFASRGFDATTMQDIADRVDLLKGSLYHYIRSKQAVLYEIIAGTHERFRRHVEVVQELPVGALARVWAFVYANVTGNADNLSYSSVFFSEFRSLRPADRQTVVGLRDAHDRVLRELLVAGQGEGTVRRDLDPKLTATAILTMCNSLYLWFRPDGEWGAAEVGRRYADFVVASLADGRPPSRSSPPWPVDGDAVAALVEEQLLSGGSDAGPAQHPR